MSDKNYGTFEKVVVRAITEFTAKDFLVERTTNYVLKELDEQDIDALHRIWDKAFYCTKDLEDSLTDYDNDYEEESENEDYE